ncbi:IS110 family transposase [Thiovibrio sp. JS02]
MESIYYIGLDVHKKTIAYCIKTANGTKVRQGVVAAERKALGQWLTELPGPWLGALEATIFTGWIYDFLKPHAVELKVAHAEMLKAITAAKKKNDQADAEKLADLLRVNLLPECTMMSTELRELRRILRYRVISGVISGDTIPIFFAKENQAGSPLQNNLTNRYYVPRYQCPQIPMNRGRHGEDIFADKKDH